MNNTYGTVKPSIINTATDVEIWYQYKPSRSSIGDDFNTFKKISNVDVSTILQPTKIAQSVIDEGEVKGTTLPGMYNLSLPVSLFGNVGFYTLYIKPKEIFCEIKDVGALAAYPETRGIIIDLDDILPDDKVLFNSDNLTGYRIEYFDSNNERQDYYRLITSGALCEPVSQNLTNANTNTTGYSYTDSGTLAFLSVSPDMTPSFKGSTQKPFIGSPNQKISIINTKFDPVCIEIEMCKNDFDTITTVLTGNQIRSLDNGILSTFNSNGELFNQYEFYTVKDTYTKTDVYDVKKNREGNYDFIDYQEIIKQ